MAGLLKLSQVLMTIPLARATAHTRLLVSAAVADVDRIFRSGFNFAKAGVMLVDLQPAASSDQRRELDLSAEHKPMAFQAGRDRFSLVDAMDSLSRRFGPGAVQIASASLASGAKPGAEERSWSTKRERRSPRYTTRWDEMPVVR